MQQSSLILNFYSSDWHKRSASSRDSECLQLAAARGSLPSLYDFMQPQLYGLRKTNLKLSIYPSEIHFILLDSLISNATSNMVQRHFTAVKHKSYFIILSNNYIVCLPVHSHEHVILKNSAGRGSSYRYWKEQTRCRAPKWRWALLIFFARLICIRTYGSIQNTTCFISVGYVLVICFWLLKAVFKFDYHFNPFELVIRHTFVTVEKSSSHRKSIFHIRIINKLELETFFSKCWKQQNVYISFVFSSYAH